jgi:hypothetical protein
LFCPTSGIWKPYSAATIKPTRAECGDGSSACKNHENVTYGTG